MNNSFYGGKDGRPFIISRKYETILAMLTDFTNDTSFTSVPLGEYCIINTKDFNNPDNGKVFRREFPNASAQSIPYHERVEQTVTAEDGKTTTILSTYTQKKAAPVGAKLIGQIVGPAGAAAQVALEKYEEVEKKKTDSVLGGQYEKHSTEGVLALKDGDILNPETNNKIYWTSCSLRDKENKESTCYVGFKIPYTRIHITSESVSPYYNRSNDTAAFVNNSLADWKNFSVLNGETNVFSQNWHINIPKGIHGQSIENLRVDNNNGEAVLKYEIRNYDKQAEGETQTVTLGDYNMIDEISISKEGTLTIQYSHDADDVWNNLLTWITSISLSETGVFNIATNNHNEGTEIIDKQLHWVKQINVSEDGTVTYTDVDTSTSTQNQLFTWITGITLTKGKIDIETNNGKTELHQQLHWVETINVEDDGTITYTDASGSTSTQSQLLTWIDAWSYNNQTGELSASLNNSSHNVQQDITIPMKCAADIVIEDGNKLVLQYNTQTAEGDIHTKDLGRFIYSGSVEPTDLSLGGLWIETIEVGEE